jgi:hypothetical protein
VVSTFAFMMGNPKTLISYDYNDAPGISVAYELAEMHGIDFKSDVVAFKMPYKTAYVIGFLLKNNIFIQNITRHDKTSKFFK